MQVMTRKRLLVALLALACLGSGGEEPYRVPEEQEVPPVPTLDHDIYRRSSASQHIQFLQTLPDPVAAFYSAETPERALANDYRFTVVNLRHGRGSLVIDREHGHVVRCAGQYRHGLGIRANDFGCDLLGGKAQ